MIGIFDSGIGGLSILMEVRRLLPKADVTYLADQLNAPYGERSLSEVRRLAEQCTVHLLDSGVDIVVVACNTASAAALHQLRSLHPAVSFVGLEPAIKPAAYVTRSGVVGVLATTATFQGELFESLVGRFGGSVQIIARACPGWVELVERAELRGRQAEALIVKHLEPVLAEGADTLVLGCTHYPFLRSLIREQAGTQVSIIDPSPAVARQVAAVYQGSPRDLASGRLHFRSTGDITQAQRVIHSLIGFDQKVTHVTWPD